MKNIIKENFVDQTKLISKSEFAKLEGVTPKAIQFRIERGTQPVVQFLGGEVCFVENLEELRHGRKKSI